MFLQEKEQKRGNFDRRFSILLLKVSERRKQSMVSLILPINVEIILCIENYPKIMILPNRPILDVGSELSASVL